MADPFRNGVGTRYRIRWSRFKRSREKKPSRPERSCSSSENSRSTKLHNLPAKLQQFQWSVPPNVTPPAIAHLNFVLSVFQYDEWSAHDRTLIGYIKTKADPPIFYLPIEHIPQTKELLAATTASIEGESSILMHLYNSVISFCFSVWFLEKIKKRQEEIKNLLDSQEEETATGDAAAEDSKEKEEAMEEEEGVAKDGDGEGEGEGLEEGQVMEEGGKVGSDSGEASD